MILLVGSSPSISLLPFVSCSQIRPATGQCRTTCDLGQLGDLVIVGYDAPSPGLSHGGVTYARGLSCFPFAHLHTFCCLCFNKTRNYHNQKDHKRDAHTFCSEKKARALVRAYGLSVDAHHPPHLTFIVTYFTQYLIFHRQSRLSYFPFFCCIPYSCSCRFPNPFIFYVGEWRGEIRRYEVFPSCYPILFFPFYIF